MLASLHIENIAVIEKADVEFDNGFSVLTGETGAGKSIIIDSINAVLGERTSRDLIRSGSEKALVSALFTNVSNEVKNKLSLLGFELEDDNLIITRTIAESKSGAKINGQPAIASMLKELSPLLINIHGQHDSQALLQQEMHYQYIDMLADNGNILNDYQTAFHEMQDIRHKLKQVSINEDEKARKIENLKYQVDELENAQIVAGERDSLIERRNVLQNIERIESAFNNSYSALSGDDDFKGILTLVDSVADELSQVSKFYTYADKLNEHILNAKFELEEVKNELSSVLADLEYDPNELQLIEERLDLLYRLSRKYGETEHEMLGYLENAKLELHNIEVSDQRILELELSLTEKVKQVKLLGAKLTKSRQEAATKFSKSVAEQLKFLDMPYVQILVDISDSSYSNIGANRIEFLISTNPGERPKPLIKIASGGELSRIMLAIKNVLAEKDSIETLIFDEIDTGISGRAAQKVGLKLKETAKGKQVICVTHLAQIAALADAHLLIEKHIYNEKAVTTITELDFNGRKHEIARIMGSDITDTTLKSAEEMLRFSY